MRGWLLWACAGMLLGCAGHWGLTERARTLGADIDWTVQPTLGVTHPPDGAILPRDLAAPRLEWEGPRRGRWLVRFEVPGQSPLCVLVDENPWVPAEDIWDAVRRKGEGQSIRLCVAALDGDQATQTGSSSFVLSSEPFAARILYLEIPVPFRRAANIPEKFAWFLADPASSARPRKILSGLPACANCHVASNDGRVFGLDFDYRGDKGGFLLADTAPRMALGPRDVLSWNTYQPGQGVVSRGLFARISPDGRYVTATVKDRPFLVRIDDPAYSQLFFPLSGKLVYLDREDGQIRALPGADDPDLVQTGSAWSADGRTIAFSRGRADASLGERLGTQAVMDAAPGEDIHRLNARYRMRFDICTVPFNKGRGGQPTLLTGAACNGMSNYFPRFTPDGRWIVFCQAPNGLVSQPGSRLHILPANGGVARLMRCNRPEFNSWHSLSPCGRWMVFSSKPDPGDREHMHGEALLTRIYLTHLDARGQDSPPVLLHRFASRGVASILPEVVSAETPISAMVFSRP